LFQKVSRPDYRQPAMNRCATSGAVIHQDGVRMDFLGETNSFQFAGVHVQRKFTDLGVWTATHGGKADAHPLTGGGVFGC
jgi:hypothetical protein